MGRFDLDHMREGGGWGFGRAGWQGEGIEGYAPPGERRTFVGHRVALLFGIFYNDE